MTQSDHDNIPTLQPPDSGVTVRMYNTGFGDCFLLAFRGLDNKGRYMLIDCGVHHGYPDGAEKITKVVKDIAAATGGRLHVVAVTHEHTDHLYGFKYAREIFEQIEIDQLWMAWTEDPEDQMARQLKERYGFRIRALRQAVKQLRLAEEPTAEPLEKLLDFEYPNSLSAWGGNSAQLQYLKDKSKKELRHPEDFRRPGEPPLNVPDVEDVNVYVLGPPRDPEWIKKLSKKSEIYHEMAGMDENDAFAAAILAAYPDSVGQSCDELLHRRTRPFDENLEVEVDKIDKIEDAETKRFFKKYYGSPDDKNHPSRWRHIDMQWLSSSEKLALSIQGKTNNTSLVLAVELAPAASGKVLLFTADAQVGNWLSWQDLAWPGQGPGGGTLTVNDLLRRTVLYKVGHHGSENATLSKKGLELMDSGELVAMIPVDTEWATSANNWEHPSRELLERLTEKSRGRIIRTDSIPDGDNAPPKPPEAGSDEWDDFVGHLDWDRSADKLWIQYTVTP